MFMGMKGLRCLGFEVLGKEKARAPCLRSIMEPGPGAARLVVGQGLTWGGSVRRPSWLRSCGHVAVSGAVRGNRPARAWFRCAVRGGHESANALEGFVVP